MIKVYFPPGCYGTYIARCIYNFTNLRPIPFEDFIFDSNGSSHDFWNKQKELSSIINYGHIGAPYLNVDAENVVAVLPCRDHKLDYFDNQYFKAENERLFDYVLNQILEEEVFYKLKTHWNYTGKLVDVPRWIMREWCSFWLNDVLKQSYESGEYNNIDSSVQILTPDIFDNWIESFAQMIQALQLTITVEVDVIKKQHNQFLKLQKFNNIQLKCEQYVKDVINDVNNNMTLHSIFDEAYVQYLLRQQNFEIHCDGLNIFPSTTQQLKTLIYAI